MKHRPMSERAYLVHFGRELDKYAAAHPLPSGTMNNEQLVTMLASVCDTLKVKLKLSEEAHLHMRNLVYSVMSKQRVIVK